MGSVLALRQSLPARSVPMIGLKQKTHEPRDLDGHRLHGCTLIPRIGRSSLSLSRLARTSGGGAAIQYMSLWLIGLPFAVAMVGSSLMRAAGDATKPSYLMTFSAVIQIVLGPLFIFASALGTDWVCRARRGVSVARFQFRDALLRHA